MFSAYVNLSENICLLFDLLLLIFFVFSKPKLTPLFKINVCCVISSILLLIIEFVLGFLLQTNPENHFGLINICMAIAVFLYLNMLCFLVAFINRLSARPTANSHIFHGIYFTLFVIWSVGAFHMAKHGWMYYMLDGKVHLYMFIPYMILPGMIAAAGAGINAIVKRKHIPRPIFNYIMLFFPLDMIALSVQYVYHYEFYLASTHVIPCVIFYVLFHASIYDAETGVMGHSSFATAAKLIDKRKKPSTIVYVYLTKLQNVDLGLNPEYTKKIQNVYRETCRMVESLDRRLNVYRLSDALFATIIPAEDENKKIELLQKFVELIKKQSALAHVKDSYKINIYDKTVFTGTDAMMPSFARYLFEKSMNYPGEVYYGTQKDIEQYLYQYRVEQLLYQIRNSGDLDNDSVQVLIQPIYSIEEGKFRTGESLMRLTMDGKMVFPDVFIPIAERTGTIHSLTLIMINKVCKIVNDLGDRFDFEAVTVNCSSNEVADERFCSEVLSLIEKNGTNKSRIRIELTESAIFGDYEKAMANIMHLNENGILFYLDDFGTGYSNFDRISQCPFHTIKFDKSILHSSLDNEFVAEVMHTMIESFKKRGYRVLVEGVETKENLDFCVKQGYQYIQGYYFSKPTSVSGLEEILAENKQLN